MSTSKHLRETHTELGGGRGIFTQGAKVLEGNLAKQVQALIPVLMVSYPDLEFVHRKTLTKSEISPEDDYTPHSKGSGVKPDGGILFVKIRGELYPILVCEAKKQGTNDVRLANEYCEEHTTTYGDDCEPIWCEECGHLKIYQVTKTDRSKNRDLI